MASTPEIKTATKPTPPRDGFPAAHDPAPAPFPAQFADLAAALHRETEMVRELRLALERQRAAVAASETEIVNQSVDAIGRILLTLDEARQRRSVMISTLAGDSRLPLQRLEETLGLTLPPELDEARAKLRVAAEEVAREVAINRAVLRRAVEAGEAFLQALFSSAADPAPVYGAREGAEDKAAGTGVLLNRRA